LTKKVKESNLAVVVTSADDLKYLREEYKDAVFLAIDYSILQEDINENIIPFLIDSDPKYIFFDIARDIASKWYRDKYGADYMCGELSMGVAIEKRVGFIVSNFIRYFSSLEYWLQKFDKIIVPSNIPEELKKPFLCFPNQVDIIDSRNPYCSQLVSLLGRAMVSKVFIHKLSSFAYRIQSILMHKKVQGKILCFPDWTYENQRNKEFIYLNSKNISNGFYLRDDKRCVDVNTIIDSIDKKLAYSSVAGVIKSSRFRINSPVFINGIVDLIGDVYCDSKSNLIQIFRVYKNLVADYNPKAIIIPATLQPAFTMLMQISIQAKVPTLVIIDGFPTYIDKYDFPIEGLGSKTLVRNFAAMGDIGASLFDRCSLPSMNIININPPLLDNFDSSCKRSVIYDAVIMMPYPNIANPNSRPDRKYKQVIDVIECLIKLRIDRIAIKVKQGRCESETMNTMKLILDRNNYNVDILNGNMSDVICSSERIVGQLGTTIVESIYSKTPFYVYEPYENGVSDTDIDNSILYNQFIARNMEALKYNLVNYKCVLIDDKVIQSSTKMSSIDFNSLIV
jgi:hypothetical protein